MNLRTVYKLFLPLLVACCCCEQEKTKTADRVVKAKDSVFIAPQKKEHSSYLEKVFKDYGLVDIHSVDTSIRVDLRYAGTNNFLKRDLYDGLRTAYFNCPAAIKLSNAQHFLKQLHPGYSLLVLDAARPHSIQQLMWDSLRMPPDIKYNYLAPPYEKSMHNYGCAADVTIIDLASGQLLDMGSGFDFFGKISEPVYEWQFLKTGGLSKAAYKNRLLLRRTMLHAGFISIHSEWWHFSSCSKAAGMAKFKLIK